MSERANEQEDRAAARRDELETTLIREAVSLAAIAVMLVMLSPGVHQWLQHQAWRVRQWQRRDVTRTEALVAELRRDISLIEHGGWF